MNGDVTVRDVMRREFVGASEGDTIRDTAALMLDEAVGSVVVVRGTDSVGMVTQRDVLAAAVDGVDIDETPISEVMRAEPPAVRADESLSSATDAMTGTESRHLLVRADDDLVGVVSEHDVVTASTLDHAVEESGPERTTEPAITEAVGATTEGIESDDEYSSQGICEVCGALTRDLSSFNGQLVCADCKDV